MFYLYGSISLLIVFGVLLLIRPDLWRQGLIPAFLFLPYGPISEQVFFSDYWSPEPVLPPMVVRGQAILIEDLIFVFGLVGIMSVAYDVVLGRRPVERLHPPRRLLAAGLSVLSLWLFIALSPHLAINSIFISSLIAFGAAWPIILIRRDLLTVAVGSSLICGLGTFIFYFTILLTPGAVDYLVAVWHLPLEQAALRVFGLPIPLTELLWAGAMAFYFGIIYKFGVGSGYRAD